jgi:carboxypeptidase C (cathepsin A)
LSSRANVSYVAPEPGGAFRINSPGRLMTTRPMTLPRTTMPLGGKSRCLRSFLLAACPLVLLAFLVAGAATLAGAQEHPRRQQAQQSEQQHPPDERQGGPREGVLRLLPPDSVTEHSIDTPAGKLAYTATAGTLSLFDPSGERLAAIFYTAYVAKNVGTGDGASAAAIERPVTFVFNGGPGAAAAYLNLGLVGPRIANFVGNDPAATRLEDNPQTWLAFTDLVLIDPVGTGWSRAPKPDGAKPFQGVNSDAEALAKTVALYLAKNGRGASPKYILGESYGGFRATKVARVLLHDQGIAVSGIVMLSPLIEGNLIFGGGRLALGAALQLPSLAAAELERKGTFSREALAEAEHFALTDYLTTLAGPPPKGDAARAFYARVAQVSGLPEDVVTRSRGFIRDAYVKNLREGKIVSRYDATFAVPDPFPELPGARGGDPILDGLTRAYGGTFVTYARDELGFKTDMTYILLASDIAGKWDWDGGGRGGASVTDDLRELLAMTPSFRLMVAHGLSDMITPYSVTRYVLDHLPPMGDPSRTQLRLYRGGHMFYLDQESRKAFSAEAKNFYQSSRSQSTQ